MKYTLTEIRYNKETGEVYSEKQLSTLFLPKYLYQTKSRVYMVGYNYPDQRVEAVDLQDVSDAALAFKHKIPQNEDVEKLLNSIEPRDYIPEERRQLIYKGPAVFRCRGQYLEELVKTFGQPSEPIVKDARCRATYTVQDAEIWADTLSWLARVPEYGIRVKGPEGLTEAIRAYYKATSEVLLDARKIAVCK